MDIPILFFTHINLNFLPFFPDLIHFLFLSNCFNLASSLAGSCSFSTRTASACIRVVNSGRLRCASAMRSRAILHPEKYGSLFHARARAGRPPVGGHRPTVAPSAAPVVRSVWRDSGAGVAEGATGFGRVRSSAG